MDTDWSVDGWEYIAVEMAGGRDDPRDVRLMAFVATAPKTLARVESGEILSIEEAHEAAKAELGRDIY